MPTSVFVINQAVLRDPRRFARRCERAAEAAGWRAVILPTASPGEGREAFRRAGDAAGDGGVVVAAGGDGTVTSAAQALAGSGIPLGIVPLGTANLTARALGLPRRAGPALAVALGGRDHAVDLATADGEVFTAMAGIGLDAIVVAATSRPGKRRLGWLAYAMTGTSRLSVPPAEFTLTTDEGPPLRRRARSVVVGNCGLLPGGFVLLPRARLDDGVLDVGILAPEGGLGWVRLAGQVLVRAGGQTARLERHQVRHVRISCETALPRQADGELLGPGTSLTVSVLPGALIVRIPARS